MKLARNVRQEAEKQVVRAIKDSDLRPFQKMFARMMKRRLAEESMEEYLTGPSEEGCCAMSSDDAEKATLGAIDWDKFFAFLEKLLPLLLNLFG